MLEGEFFVPALPESRNLFQSSSVQFFSIFPLPFLSPNFALISAFIFPLHNSHWFTIVWLLNWGRRGECLPGPKVFACFSFFECMWGWGG